MKIRHRARSFSTRLVSGSKAGTSDRRGILKLRLFSLFLVSVAAVACNDSEPVNNNEGSQNPENVDFAETTRPLEPHGFVPSNNKAPWKSIDNPAKDGWDTELFASRVKKQLKAVGKLLAHPDEIDKAGVERFITADFVSEPLRPADLATVLDDQHLKIERPSRIAKSRDLAARPPDGELPLRGAAGLAEAMRDVVAPFAGATDVRFEVKVFRVVSADAAAATRQYFSISGRTEAGIVEQHATWDIGWEQPGPGMPPRMRWLRVAEFEQTESRQRAGGFFADCTESVLGENDSYAAQFLRGANYWFERIQDPSRFAILGNPGVAVGDVNGDGLDDLYVCQEAGLPNRLFVQNADGTARDVSMAWGVDWLESSRSALLVDLDNDSDQDLVVAILGGVVLAENVGQQRFRLRNVLASCEDTMSLSAVDYDMDGRLDIYVCGYFEDRAAAHSSTVGLPGAAADFVVHDANNGGRNNLFRNQISGDGEWRFSDVTADVGLDENNYRYSLAASWDDFDNDGDLDLYVANDYGRDHFYRNDIRGVLASGGVERRTVKQFSDISETAHVENSAAGMSITWGDYDRDGWMDVLVSNMWSSAGKRIAYQQDFQPDASDKIKQRYQRLARGNTLLRNRGDKTFEDRSAPAGIEMGRWAWGSHFVDFNNDGWEDLFVANGYLTTPDTGDL